MHVTAMFCLVRQHYKLADAFRSLSVLQVEAKIAEELWQQGLLATPEEPHPRAPDYADLGKLTYLSCVIKEAMRIHTVASVRKESPTA